MYTGLIMVIDYKKLMYKLEMDMWDSLIVKGDCEDTKKLFNKNENLIKRLSKWDLKANSKPRVIQHLKN